MGEERSVKDTLIRRVVGGLEKGQYIEQLIQEGLNQFSL
jgi:hypothetical protein